MAPQGGFGLKLKIMVSTTLTIVADLIDGDMPEQEKVLAEMTAHDSASGYAEWIATGKFMLNEFKVTLAWDSAAATHAAVVTAFDSTSPVSMSIEDPGGVEVIAFSGHVKKLGRISRQDDVYKCDVAIQPTGAPSIT